jgi:hypothetical protein
MSGYNPATGIYELTMTKAEYWSGSKNKDMHYYAEALRARGLAVIEVRQHFLKAKGQEEEIKKILQNKRRDRQ